MKSNVLIIDHESCWGCRTCEVACKQEIRSPEGVQLIKVLEDGPHIREGKPEFTFRVNVCQHCDEPVCVDVCPEDAIVKRDDAIVILNEDKCIGCMLCIDECPFNAIAFDSERGVAQKCNLCFHRVDNGLIPACADNVCPGHCIHFGDPDVIQKEIAEKHSRRAKEPVADIVDWGRKHRKGSLEPTGTIFKRSQKEVMTRLMESKNRTGGIHDIETY